MTIKFNITNLTCDACIKISGIVLKKIPGVKNVEIERNGAALVESENGISQDEIKKVLSSVDKIAVFN